MNILSKFRRTSKADLPELDAPSWMPSEEGLLWRSAPRGLGSECLEELTECGLATCHQGGWTIPWAVLYRLLSEEEFEGVVGVLALPKAENSSVPFLRAAGSFSDETFQIQIDGWRSSDNDSFQHRHRIGSMLESSGEWLLLREPIHRLLGIIKDIRASANQEERMKAWAGAREIAIHEQVGLDGFLRTSICLTPERLRFRIFESSTGICTLEPTFDQAPDGWVKQFDQRLEYPARVDVAGSDGNQVSVFLSPGIRDVLKSIRRQFPTRNLDSVKGRRFVRNPWTFFSEAGASVVGPVDVEQGASPHLSHTLEWKCEEIDGKVDSILLHLHPANSEHAAVSVRKLDRAEFRSLLDELAGAVFTEEPEFRALDRWVIREPGSEEMLQEWRAVLSRWDAEASGMLETRESVDEKDERLLAVDSPWIPEGEEGASVVLGEGKEKAAKSSRIGIKQADGVDERSDLVGQSAPVWSPPIGLREAIKMKPHQADGVRWLWERFPHEPHQTSSGAILADDMGLGKTLQGLSFLSSLFESRGDLDPALIVAPVSILENWMREVSTFFEDGTLRVLKLHGDSLRERVVSTEIQDPILFEKGILRCLESGWRSGHHIVITSYEVLRDYETSLAALPWSVVILDEAQRIKNPFSFLSGAARALPARFRIACTGTPVENSLRDLWSLFQFVKPGYLDPLDDFNETYRKPIEVRTPAEKLRLDELRAKVEPWILRRTKSDVAPELPPKIFHKGRDSGGILPLSNEQLHLYKVAADRFKTIQVKLKDKALTQIFKTLGELRMICALAVPGSGGEIPSPSKIPKAKWLVERITEIQARGEKVLVFSEFLEVQLQIRSWITQELGVAVDVLNGTTPVDGPMGRQARIERFSKAPGFGVLVLGTKALGAGVNIQAANHVIHFTRSWNPAIEDQATDRAYRIGQTRPVHVHTPTMTHPNGTFPTFEETLEKLLERKRALASDILNGASSDVSFDDFLEALDCS